jgi:YD repeat-containing protein
MSVKPVTTVNSQPGLVVRDIDTDKATDLVADTHYLIVANAVIDEDGDWVPMVQPTLNATLSGVTIEGETVYKDSRIEYDNYGNAIYIGDNEVMNASEAATDWEITKVYYDAYSNVIEMKQKTGSWTDRTVGW